MICPVCGVTSLVPETRDLPCSYRNESTSIAAVMGDFCPACGDALLDASESARVSAAMLAFKEQIDATN
ncbi:hypothetical protein CJU73_01570 [Pseudomonas fragi]|uniref:type II toxin-antitoxin system MqsA family antitoxin n=1 Tax=Pseudomonas fragi TaxID=296 RepID=UPI000BA25AB1|nr:type II toxin-antitoxin system MqsA family antitoxin [Pseudomonas fragi]PAA31746.1 hypothetical protein CJU73_01570 [Pseudomonas fragi]